MITGPVARSGRCRRFLGRFLPETVMVRRWAQAVGCLGQPFKLGAVQIPRIQDHRTAATRKESMRPLGLTTRI